MVNKDQSNLRNGNKVKSIEDAVYVSKSIVSQKHVKITPLCHEKFQNPVEIAQLCQYQCHCFDRTKRWASKLASTCSPEQKILIV